MSLPLINAEAVHSALSQLFAATQKNASDLQKYRSKTEKRLQRAEQRLSDFEASLCLFLPTPNPYQTLPGEEEPTGL